uniref:40S ribosomal protein S15 n=1 Tax=Pongo abelii TaxID=9601 RepID=A0A8I5TFU8_PONAB
MAEVEQKKKRTFRKFTYRGVDLEQLLDKSHEPLIQLYSARQRRRLNWGLRRKQHSLLKRLRKAKKAVPPMEKPEVVKTHLRDMIILPEMVGSMVGSMVGVYNGKTFNQVEVKPEMVSHYLGEFSITYKPVKHSRLQGHPLLLLHPPQVVAQLIKAHVSKKKKNIYIYIKS